MTAYSETEHREAAARLVGFAQDEAAAPIIRMHAAFLCTPVGRQIWRELFALADGLHCGDFPPEQYDGIVEAMAATAALPVDEFRVIARLALEFDRCAFFGHGNRPMFDLQFHDQNGR